MIKEFCNWLDKMHNWPYPTKSCSLTCYLSLMIVSMQKSKILVDSFEKYWWSKNPAIWLAKKYSSPHQIKSNSLSTFAWCLSPCKKSKRLPRSTTSHTQPKVIVSLSLLDVYLCAKNLRDCWISFRYINDQRIMLSDWTRGTSGYTQPKLVISDATFFWWLSPCKKQKIWCINWFLPRMLMLKKSCNLIGQEVELATPKQK